jgi:glycerol-3-phosphate dehydrogenase
MDERMMDATRRPELLAKLAEKTYDLLVIGGGITGCGIALDAATRGLSVALVEKASYASGTSGRSTKLIHGGLRYLAQGDIRLVQEVGRERTILHRNAPHLVLSERMMLPIVRGGSYKKWSAFIGLSIYDRLAKVIPEERKKLLSRASTLSEAPLLPDSSTLGAFRYAEYRTDDARLTLAVIKSAVERGAVAANYVAVEELLYDKDGRVAGARCSDKLANDTSTPIEIRARVVINAAGPWVDAVREKDAEIQGKALHHTKGVHLVVDHADFPIGEAMYFDVFDGRMLFAIPRGRSTYFGTTDTNYSGEPDDVQVSSEDVDYLLAAVERMFPTLGLTREKIRSSWAGIRPLIHEPGKGPSEISRKDEIFISNSGIISIAGGKLTGFRKMAERTTDAAVEALGRVVHPCSTEQIVLHGGAFASYAEVLSLQTALAAEIEAAVKPAIAPQLDSEFEAFQLVHNFGTAAQEIVTATKTGHGNTLLTTEVQYCIQHESLQRLVDFYVQHTGRLYFQPGAIRSSLNEAAAAMGAMLNWDSKRTKQEVEAVETALHAATDFKTKTTTKTKSSLNR